jgi:hypothetical protein
MTVGGCWSLLEVTAVLRSLGGALKFFVLLSSCCIGRIMNLEILHGLFDFHRENKGICAKHARIDECSRSSLQH